MNIFALYLAAGIALVMFLARLFAWRYRVRQVRRRRERRPGYLPVFDQDWTPKR